MIWLLRQNLQKQIVTQPGPSLQASRPLLCPACDCVPLHQPHRALLQVACAGPGGITPLHMLAVAPEASALLPLLVTTPEAASLWFTAQAFDSATAADFAQRLGRPELNIQAEALRQQHAQARQLARVKPDQALACCADMALAVRTAPPELQVVDTSGSEAGHSSLDDGRSSVDTPTACSGLTAPLLSSAPGVDSLPLFNAVCADPHQALCGPFPGQAGPLHKWPAVLTLAAIGCLGTCLVLMHRAIM